MMTLKTHKSFSSLVYGLAVACISFVAAWHGYDFVKVKGEATDIIVTVFSILAGFIIAIMTLLGEQALPPGNWRIAELNRSSIIGRLTRQKWLFYTYLAVLCIIFVTALLRGQEQLISAGWIALLERSYFGLSVFAFLMSFRLPAALLNIQLTRIDTIIEAKRKKTSILEK